MICNQNVSFGLHGTDRDRLTRNRFSTTGVGDADELLQENGVLIVVPVTEDDSEFLVVLVLFLLWVNHNT